MTDRSISIVRAIAGACLALIFIATALPAQAQNGANGQPVERDPITGRKVHSGDPVYLNFNNVKIEDTIPFITETTGKTVIPARAVMSNVITVVSERPLTRDEALNLLFVAFLELRVGVVESKDVIRIDTIDELVKRDIPVVGVRERLADRTDDGVIITKIFKPRYTAVGGLGEIFNEMVPDWADIQVDSTSNSMVAIVSVGLGKRLERMIEEIDQTPLNETRTFELRYADAATIADRILAFYAPEESAGGGGGGNRNQNVQFQGGRRVVQDTAGSGGGAGGTSVGGGDAFIPVRAVADTRNNLVTVQGSPELLDEIEKQIRLYWDREFNPEKEEIVKIYEVRYTDAVVVSNVLKEIMDQPATGGGGGRPAVQRDGAAAGGGGASAGTGSTRLADLYKIEPMPSVNRIVAIAKTSESFGILDGIIAQIDQPGMDIQPMIIELKHADAEELARELNVAFQHVGSNIGLEGRESGLSGFTGRRSTDAQDQAQNETPQQQTVVDFPWQRARPNENEAPVHELIGKVRVMPIFRQNALLIVGAPHYQDRVARMVEQLDRPGRQVLITAVIAEVQLDDLLALGLRWSRGPLGSPRDNQLGAGADFTGTENDFLANFFDTAVLNVNADLNVVLDALDRDSNLRVLSKPRIFTHDNEQANFFDGQDIQFVTNSLTDLQTGNLNNSFEFQQVGITLSTRPRITVNRDIDLEVNLRLSSLAPEATAAGGLIVNLRETRTRVVVEDGQTIVVSGILREAESQITRKVPVLGSIPLLGALFTSVENQTTRSELIAFITPIVVDNPSENDSLNEPFRHRLEDLQRPLKEQLRHPSETDHVWDTYRPVDRTPGPAPLPETPVVDEANIDAFQRPDFELVEEADGN
ncbi:MAG: type II secretion system protein GspD [Phycisphaerales bacterium]